MQAGALGCAARSSTFLDVGLGRLDALCAAVGFPDSRREQALATIQDLLAPWGHGRLADEPRFPSDIGDDHFPIELSLAIADDDVEVRVLFEAQAPGARLLDLWEAGCAVNEVLAQRYGANLERFKKLKDLFVPRPDARYALWHAACFTRHAEPAFKLYVNPQARGQEQARGLIAEALARLGFGQRAIETATKPRPAAQLKFFALDLDAAPSARVKVYYAHQGADRRVIDAELEQVPGFSPGELDDFWRLIAVTEGPFSGLPVTTYLSFTAGDDRPTSGIVHFPVRDYAEHDRVVYDRIQTLLRGTERELYARAVAGFALRPLHRGVGLQTYVAQRVGCAGRRLTVYLSPEGYRVMPPRSSDAPASRSGFSFEGTLASLGFEGEVTTAESALRHASKDVGELVTKAPRVVLRPSSLQDLQLAVRGCRRHGVPLVARGQGRTPFGQSQIEDGVVVDMGGLGRIRSISEHALTVDAGATWAAVLRESAALGLAPPVLTAFQGLSVGGTLSMGGLSGTSYKRGAQVDHVLELEVVTGEGELLTCSASSNRELFDMVRAGLGQCAIIARATLPLLRTPSLVRHCTRRYAGLAPFLADLRTLVARAELDGVSGTFYVRPDGIGIELNAVAFMESETPANMDWLLRGLSSPSSTSTRDLERLAYYLEVDGLVDELKSRSAWEGLARPWFDVFLADFAIDDWLPAVLRQLSVDDVGPSELGALGQLHLFPLLGEHLKSPLLRVPAGGLVHLFDILSCAHRAGDPAWAERMLSRNRRLFEEARLAGGTKYNIAAIPFSVADWEAQLGPHYGELSRIKQRHDPDGILNPSLGMFR